MLLREKLAELEKSKVFLDWGKNNKESYLAHIFRMYDEKNENIWQFGYYNKDDTITTFIVEGDKIDGLPEQEIFKPDKHKLPKLDIKDVSLGFEDAMEKARKLQKENYSKHPIMKSFAILQKIGEEQVFNITFITQTFCTINIRIRSDNGKIIKENLTNLMDIAQVKKGSAEETNYIG